MRQGSGRGCDVPPTWLSDPVIARADIGALRGGVPLLELFSKGFELSFQGVMGLLQLGDLGFQRFEARR